MSDTVILVLALVLFWPAVFAVAEFAYVLFGEGLVPPYRRPRRDQPPKVDPK